MGGGGNNPSCGCDMQAGWPSASVFPRGGLQGGGNWNFNEFNLALTKNGKTRHLRGKWNANNKSPSPSKNTPTANLDEEMMKRSPQTPMATEEYTLGQTPPAPKTPEYNAMLPPAPNTPQSSKPPKGYKQIVRNNQVYYLKGKNVFEKNPNGSKGKRVGTLKRTKNGTTIERTNKNQGTPLTNENYNTLGTNEEEETTPRSLANQGGGGDPVCGSCPFPGTGYCDFYAKGGSRRGGSCGCGGRFNQQNQLQQGGGCGCGGPLFKGGYRPTRKNLNALKKWKQGKSIGFTMTASLKAKGLIPRTSKTMKGKRVVSRKYK